MEKLIRKHGSGWKKITNCIYDHTTGIRLHLSGMARLPNGKFIFINKSPEFEYFSKAEKITGNRKRALMIWSLWCFYDRRIN